MSLGLKMCTVACTDSFFQCLCQRVYMKI